MFYAINIQAGTTTASNVQGNTIKNFSLSNSSSDSSNFYCINVSGGSLNLGTTTGNTIGDTTGTGSITFSIGTFSHASLYGICITTDGTVDCRNNNIGSITTEGSSSSGPPIYGIYKSGSGATTINNNLIGSTVTANSINAIYDAKVYGINSAGTGTVSISGNTISNLSKGYSSSGSGCIQGIYISGGTNTITNNIVSNLTNANLYNNLLSSVSAGGIIFNSTTPAAQTISNNTISGLSNTGAGSVIGLYYNGGTTASTVNGNFINSLVTSSSGLSSGKMIYGIKINAGATTYSNNVISLGGNPRATLFGIYETGASGNDNNLYFNTIYLGGTAEYFLSGKNRISLNSFALYSAVITNTRNFRNNIFENARINNNVACTTKHYAAYFSANTSGTSLTIDYNDYYTPGVNGGTFGHFNGADVTSLAAWQGATGQDVNSQNINPQFPIGAKSNGTTILELKPGVNITGLTLAEVPKDYSDYTRTEPPSLGAIQTDNPLPVLLSQFTYRINLRDIILNWVTASEINNAGFEVQRAVNSQQASGNWEKIGFVTGKGTTNTQTSYTFTDTKLNAGKYQYRLKQIDNNGNFEYHNLNGIVEVGLPTKYTLSQNYPNPFNPTTKIDFALPNDSKVSIKIYDITGREVMNIMNNEQKTAGYYTININPSMLSSGIYFYRMISGKFIETKKMAIVK